MADERPSYAQINRKVWNTCQFRELSREARELFFYLTTCPHGNMLGMYVIRPGYALDDLQWGTDREAFRKPFSEVLSKGLFKYDPKTEVILDLEQIVKHSPTNPNQVTACIKIVNSLPKTPLFKDLKVLVEGLSKDFMKPLAKRLGERFAESVTVTEAVSGSEDKEHEPSAPPQNGNGSQEAFSLPSKEFIREAAEPAILQLIERACKALYDENIFPDVFAFKNKMLKKKNARSILHTLCRAYVKREFEEGPWAYCQKTIDAESMNYNARDHQKTS